MRFRKVKKMPKGLFITFEGVDGCGKSTQIRFVSEYLAEQGVDFLLTREPGGCAISECIRDILLNVEHAGMNPYTEALLYAAARTQHIDEVILPALNGGRLVLCDRFLDSSIAYQGYGRQIGKQAVLGMNIYAVKRCMPDHTILLSLPPENAFLRMNPQKELDRMENEPAEFFNRVYEGFREIAENEKNRVIRVDVSGTKFETRDKIRCIMERILNKWRTS
jgi:dTMP kinase